ncbi:hypothetical protein [Protofrankia coriariae]|nr:hypothetical protein [Protofrankia coriariae]
MGCLLAGVEHVADRLLVEPDQRDHDAVVGGEPADDPDRDVRIERVGDAPELVAAGLPYPFESRGLLERSGQELSERLQERDGDGEEGASLFFRAGQPAVELVGPVDDHHPEYEPRLIQRQAHTPLRAETVPTMH